VTQSTVAPGGTVAGRPQPQTTAETAGGPFIRHAPDGRRAQYVDTQTYGGFMSRPTVSMPGYAKGYRMLVNLNTGTNAASAPTTAPDFPQNYMQLVQMKDAFGTQLLTGPGYVIGFEVPLYSGQFGTDEMRNPNNSPANIVFNTTLSATPTTIQFSTYFPFEFAKGYGVISGANAALLPVLQINIAPSTALFATNQPTTPPGNTAGTASQTLDSDFYWLPSAPVDPPGLGTTCQYIYQPSNPTIPSTGSQLVQLPRLGGYLTMLILELRGSTGARITENGSTDTGWPVRPKLLVDGVPLVDTLMTTWFEDLAINMQVGAINAAVTNAAGGTQSGVVQSPRPSGTYAISRKTSLAQRDFGLLDTGEIFLSTNPGTQLEIAGFPWGTAINSPMTLNATVGQVVPSGTLVQGLPEV
jgi:hypothetical protein